MKQSEMLYQHVQDLWREAADKPFVKEMAKGSLDPDRFHYYMIQDYMYLQDYIKLLEKAQEYTKNPELISFLDSVIVETKGEAGRVHEKYFVSHAGDLSRHQHILSSVYDKKEPILTEYVAYMNRQLNKEGLLAGLTALLQCSWVYAYIGQTCMERYAKDIMTSPYRDWFSAYTCQDYLDANQAWIRAVDKLAIAISPEASDKLCRIFANCAGYENRFWDRLAQVNL